MHIQIIEEAQTWSELERGGYGFDPKGVFEGIGVWAGVGPWMVFASPQEVDRYVVSVMLAGFNWWAVHC